MANALSRNMGAVTADPPAMPNFSIQQLAEAQRNHDVWKVVIYALKSGDKTTLLFLPVPFSQFSLSSDGILCRFWPSKWHPVEQFMILEALVPTVLYLAHDAIVAGHPERERTLTALHTHYFWPTMKIDVQKHVDRCVKCAQYTRTSIYDASLYNFSRLRCSCI